MNGLDGKTAVVTGAASGIGRASAQRFAEEGTNVVVADIAVEAGRETVELIEDAGSNATFVEVDITEAESVDHMVDVAVDTYASLDFAHNNAGVLTSFSEVTTITEEQWDRLLAINLKGIWTCMKAELPVIEKGAVARSSTRPPSPAWSA